MATIKYFWPEIVFWYVLNWTGNAEYLIGIQSYFPPTCFHDFLMTNSTFQISLHFAVTINAQKKGNTVTELLRLFYTAIVQHSDTKASLEAAKAPPSHGG